MSKSAAGTEAPAAEAKQIDVARRRLTKILANVEKVIIGKRAADQPLPRRLFLRRPHSFGRRAGRGQNDAGPSWRAALAASSNACNARPDLLPTDVTGVSIFNQKTAEFEFRPGPLFAQTVLADEINRTTPRTQSALLEAMAERRITVDGTTYTLKPPFLVMATQNPIDHEGTFPLPEAQLDRFLIKLSLGYPSVEEEGRMLDRMQHSHPIDDLPTVASAAEVIACQEAIRSVYVDDQVRNYLLQIVEKTRNHEDVRFGGSPRALIALYRTSQAVAAMAGRDYVMPDDVKRMVMSVLAHRIILRPESRLRKVTPISVVAGYSARCGRAGAGFQKEPSRGSIPMKWWLGAGPLLLAALILESGLLAYAMYVLLAIMLISRLLARSWVTHVHAKPSFLEPTAEIGDDVRVLVRVKNSGFLARPLDFARRSAAGARLSQRPPRLKVKGKRIQLKLLRPGAEITVKYHLHCLMRGYHQIGPLLLESGDLFGLHRRYRIDASPQLLAGLSAAWSAFRATTWRHAGLLAMCNWCTGFSRIPHATPACGPINLAIRSTACTGEPRHERACCIARSMNRRPWPGPRLCSIFTAAPTQSGANPIGRSSRLRPRFLSQMRSSNWASRSASSATAGMPPSASAWKAGTTNIARAPAARRQTAMLKVSERLEPMIVETRRGAEQFQRTRETLARLELTEGLTFAELILETSSRLPATPPSFVFWPRLWRKPRCAWGICAARASQFRLSLFGRTNRRWRPVTAGCFRREFAISASSKRKRSCRNYASSKWAELRLISWRCAREDIVRQTHYCLTRSHGDG